MKNEVTKIPTILLKKVVHRDKTQLVLLFPFNTEIKNTLYNIGGYLWSKTLRGWYIEFTSKNIDLLKEVLKDKVTFVLDSSIDKELNVNPPFKKRAISEEKELIIKLFTHYLTKNKHNESTVKTYVSIIEEIFEYIQEMPISNVSNSIIELFIVEILEPRNYKISTKTQFINAIKLFKAFYPECKIN